MIYDKMTLQIRQGETDLSGRLLEKLAKEEHCFISDLNRACDYEEIIRYLKGLDLSQYSLEECSYAFSYIFQETLLFNSYEQVDDFFKLKTVKQLSQAPCQSCGLE